MVLSIIIVSSNCQNDLLNCLASIYQYPPTGDFEIIVVDNASSDQTAALIRNQFSQVKLIVNPQNLGFAAANNLGAKNALGDYLFFLNPDTIISNSGIFTSIHRCIGVEMKDQRSIRQLADKNQKYKSKIKDEEEIAIVGSKLVDQNGDFQWSCGPIPSIFNMILDKPLAATYRYLGGNRWVLKLLSSLSPRYYQGQQPLEVGFVSGAAMMIKKSVFDELNGFDEKFFLYFEDVDLCLRAQKAGYQVVYLPTVEITHLSGQSQKDRLKQKEEWYYKSQRYFFAKHKRQWERILVELLSIPYRLSGLRSRINKYY